MTPQMTREVWLAGLESMTEAAGECLEWHGPTMNGKTPVVYVPRGYVLPEWGQYRQSARVVLWALAHGERPPLGHVLRTCCGNDWCVRVEHMRPISRANAPKEQARRGEFSTPTSSAAAIARARSRRTKLSVESAREIRESAQTSAELAARFGVSKATVTAVRRGALWPETTRAASVFTWRPQ